MLFLPFSLLIGDDDEPPGDEVSTRILDATLDLAAAYGIQNMTMDAVARRAGVGRMTVYRRFGGKRALVVALAEREGRRCIAELDASTQPDSPIAEQIAAGLLTSVRIAREHPLLSRLTRLEPEMVLGSLTKDGSALFGVIRTYLAERLRESQNAGVLGEIEVEDVAELLVRLGVSFALIPESVLPLEDEDRFRSLVHRVLPPALAR